MKNWFTKKKAFGLAAIVVAAAILIAGTFTWVDFSQHKTNPFTGGGAGGAGHHPDATLNDDFTPPTDWKPGDTVNKDISVTSPSNSTEGVYVRIQLKEYLEAFDVTYSPIKDKGKEVLFATWATGPKTGEYMTYAEAQAAGFQYGRLTVNGVDYAVTNTAELRNGIYGKYMDDPNSAVIGTTPIMQYGGSKLEQHVNAGQVTAECGYEVHKWLQNGLNCDIHDRISASNSKTIHDYITWTLGPDVIMLADWQAAGKPSVAKWILDPATGWAYWGKALYHTTTSNLLDAVTLTNMPGQKFNYDIHVDMQAVSYDDLDKFPGDAVPGDVMEKWTDDGKVPGKVDPTSITLGASNATVVVGETINAPSVTAVPAGANSTVTWSSANPAIASVNPSTGVVTGVAPGTTTITATTPNGKTASYTVTVTPATIAPTGVTLGTPNSTVVVGDKVGAPTVTVTPAGAPQTVTWSSANPSIATVDPATGEVTGVAVGTATITASTANGKTANYIITVTPATINPTGVTLGTPPTTVDIGAKVNGPTVTVTPSGAPQSVTWTSSDPTIATVNPTTGEVTGVKAGTATITASTPNGKTASYPITVVDRVLPLNPDAGGVTPSNPNDPMYDNNMQVQNSFVWFSTQPLGGVPHDTVFSFYMVGQAPKYAATQMASDNGEPVSYGYIPLSLFVNASAYGSNLSGITVASVKDAQGNAMPSGTIVTGQGLDLSDRGGDSTPAGKACLIFKYLPSYAEALAGEGAPVKELYVVLTDGTKTSAPFRVYVPATGLVNP